MESWLQVSKNLRFLLWQEDGDRNRWPESLRRRLQVEWRADRVEAALAGQALTETEVHQVVEAFKAEIDEEMLRYADLVHDAEVNVLSENIKYLIGSLEHGGKKELSAALKVDQTTISRWLGGTNKPPRPTQARIVRFLGLAPSKDLEQDALFLEYAPISVQSRRQWLRERVDKMTMDEIRDLFPALERLLRKP